MLGYVINGRYQIHRQLGEGGFGVVYRAYDLQEERLVAIKILNVNAQKDPQQADRFMTEARITRKLEHPSLLTIYDASQVIELDVPNEHIILGQLFIVSELLVGASLELILQHKALKLPQLTSLLKQVCTALTIAHEAGVIHRDIKPPNLYIHQGQAGEQVKLLDFGIAKVTGESHHTLTGQLFGTPYYMSPEQIYGQKELTPATDIYSVGVLCFHCLAGRVPFDGDSQYMIFHKHINDPLPPLSRNHPELMVPELQSFIERLMAKKPADRFQSCQEIIEELKVLEASYPEWFVEPRSLLADLPIHREDTGKRPLPPSDPTQSGLPAHNAQDYEELEELEEFEELDELEELEELINPHFPAQLVATSEQQTASMFLPELVAAQEQDLYSGEDDETDPLRASQGQLEARSQELTQRYGVDRHHPTVRSSRAVEQVYVPPVLGMEPSSTEATAIVSPQLIGRLARAKTGEATIASLNTTLSAYPEGSRSGINQRLLAMGLLVASALILFFTLRSPAQQTPKVRKLSGAMATQNGPTNDVDITSKLKSDQLQIEALTSQKEDIPMPTDSLSVGEAEDIVAPNQGHSQVARSSSRSPKKRVKRRQKRPKRSIARRARVKPSAQVTRAKSDASALGSASPQPAPVPVQEQELTPMIDDDEEREPKRVATSVTLRLVNGKVSYTMGEHAQLRVTVYDQHKKPLANQPYRLTYLNKSKRVNQTKKSSKVLFKPNSEGLWSIKACVTTGQCSEITEVHFVERKLFKELGH